MMKMTVAGSLSCACPMRKWWAGCESSADDDGYCDEGHNDDDDGDDDDDGFSGEQQQQVVTVGKQEAVLYTWDNALGKRELVWTCGKKKDVKTDLTQVGHGIVGILLHTCS